MLGNDDDEDDTDLLDLDSNFRLIFLSETLRLIHALSRTP